MWQEVVKFITDPSFIKTMMTEVRSLHDGDPGLREKERLKAKLYGINSQIDAVAERLTQLPKNVSAAPIFKQMEKLEAAKKEIEESLAKVTKVPFNIEQRLVKLKTFEAFTDHYRQVISNADHETKKKMVQKLIKRIEVGVNSIKIQWHMDQEHYARELALRGHSPALSVAVEEESLRKFKNNSSYSLTSGALGET